MGREFYRFIPIIMFVLLITSLKAFAATTSTKLSTQDSINDFWDRVSGSTSNTYQNNGFVDANKSSSLDSWNRLNYKMTSVDSLNLDFVINKNFTGEEKWTINDPFIGYTRSNIFKTKSSSFGLGFRVGIPLSESSRLTQNKITYLSVVPSFSFNYGIYSFAALAILTRHIYEYESDINGSINKMWSLTSLLVNSFQLAKKWSTTVVLVYVNTVNFGNAAQADQFFHDESISYQVNKSLSFSVGHSIGGRLVDYSSGRDEVFNLYDIKASQFYTNFQYNF